MIKDKVQYQKPDFLNRLIHIDYGFGQTPFAEALVLLSQYPEGDLKLVGLAFVNFRIRKNKKIVLADMKKRFPNAQFDLKTKKTTAFLKKICQTGKAPMMLIGTQFQQRVWQKLLALPKGQVIAYGALASSLGSPNAARAVGSAVGRNPISWLVPCHRVIRSDGHLGGYHWGLTLKKKLLHSEGVFLSEKFENC